MNLDERIDRMVDKLWDLDVEVANGRMRRALEVGFPELFSDPPTHWLAPMEATEGMREAVAYGSYTTFSYGGDTNSFDYFSADNASEVFADMRDAYLKAGV